MAFVRLSLKLDIKRQDPNNDLRVQYSRPTLTPPTASISYRRSSPPPRSCQGISRSHTTPIPHSKSQNRQQAPVTHSNSNYQPVTQLKPFNRPPGIEPGTAKRSNSCPPPRPKTFLPLPPFKQQQAQCRIASTVTIDSYWSLEGLPSNHEHRRIRRSQTDNIAKVSTWMDNHKGLAQGHPMNSRTAKCFHNRNVQSSNRTRFFQKALKTGNHNDCVECHGPARVMVPGGRPENHYVAYFGAKLDGTMYRARYHSYSKALQDPDRRVRDQFQQKYLGFFGK